MRKEEQTYRTRLERHLDELKWLYMERVDMPGTVQNRIFKGLRTLETVRAQEPVFDASASFCTVETGDNAVLGLRRTAGGESVTGFFNFSEQPRTAALCEKDGPYLDMVAGTALKTPEAELDGYGFLWLKNE